VKLAPGDDLIMSNMYSLLNYIAATSKELSANSHAKPLGNSPYFHAYDHATVTSVETGLRCFDESQRRLIGTSTIFVVTQLALEFDDEEVSSDVVDTSIEIKIWCFFLGYPPNLLYATSTT